LAVSGVVLEFGEAEGVEWGEELAGAALAFEVEAVVFVEVVGGQAGG
jgi:hypothetical protein